MILEKIAIIRVIFGFLFNYLLFKFDEIIFLFFINIYLFRDLKYSDSNIILRYSNNSFTLSNLFNQIKIIKNSHINLKKSRNTSDGSFSSSRM